MSQAKETVVRLEALDGGWETCGVDRLRGITPDLSPLLANGWGPDTASFDLRRDPKAIWPDLGAWTPAEIEIGGVLVWDGRVKETPSRDGTDRLMSVQCEGWQYHLDDDVFERSYVHTRMREWRDCRSFLGERLTAYTTAGSVQVGDGGITIGWPNGTVLPAGAHVGIKLNLGEHSPAKTVVALFQGITGAANSAAQIYIRGSNGEADFDASTDYFEDGNSMPFGLSVLGTNLTATDNVFTTARQYVSIFLYVPSAVTLTGDVMLQIKSITAFVDDAYRFDHGSVLKAPTVINDALDRGTLLLSSDRSQINAGDTVSFNIPDLAPGEPRTPREMWQAANAYHDYRSQIAVGRRPVFAPRPAAPVFEVGAWSPMEFEDASANSGEQIYNRVIVTGQAPDGSPVRVTRRTGEQPGSGPSASSGPSPAAINPSANTDTTGWTVFGTESITRDTTIFRTAPASFKLTNSSGNIFNSDQVDVGLTAGFTFRAGLLYALEVQMQATGAGAACTLLFGATPLPVVAFTGSNMFPTLKPGNYGRLDIPSIPTSFGPQTVYWSPAFDVDSGSVKLQFLAGNGTYFPTAIWFDNVNLFRAGSTLVDRRGFRRSKILQVRAALPADGVAAAQIGDTWLAGHKTTPFKGTVKLTGDQAVRTILTGEYVPLERLLLATGELLRFTDRVDPDSGGWGRDGRIAAVSYDPAKNEATVTLDSQRAGFEALLERLAVVTGGS